VLSADRDLHNAYRVELSQLQDRERQQQEQQESLEALVYQVQSERDHLAIRRAERAALLDDLRQSESRQRAMLIERERAALGLRRQLATPQKVDRRWQSMGFGALRGTLYWPADGPLRATFGRQVEMISGTEITNNGITIAAPRGSEVRAIAPGEVLWADWLEGYGIVVIIDHGSLYHTVSAHLDELNVAFGDTVDTAEAIGTVGATGSLYGTQLYFELRHKARPVDPGPWMLR